MFTKILIANRGEIACRIAATAQRLGIKAVAVYSEADANARHVVMCDEAVPIGPAAAQDSYLRIERIIEAALATGVQAIHPGYGFLSENEELANACIRAGLAFIGPPATAIRAMGSKSSAKTLMEKAGVPVVPGYHGDDQNEDVLLKHADRIGYPVLLKASAGGGGKGMRVVERDEDFKAALASCKREATSSFGDDKVLIEKYLLGPRHIEIQIFGDGLGNFVHLFERDCSVQRRHQKVLEEAPAPGMTEERRRAMGEAALAAAKAVGYIGAGTVEFIVAQDGVFYFMEMNTRLQVEHPVTEMITGVDLVEWQLRVAAGQPLPKKQAEFEIHGHAFEARIYAENPENGFLPSTGILRYLRTPEAVTFEHGVGVSATTPAAVRIDSGVVEGDEISPFYDPMIAKLIVWGESREVALGRLSLALSEYQIVGLATNIAFLKRLVESRPFMQAELETGLIEHHDDILFPENRHATGSALAVATAALLLFEQARGAAQLEEPWDLDNGWRLNSVLERALAFTEGDATHSITVTYLRNGWMVNIGGKSVSLAVIEHDGQHLTVRFGSRTVRGTVVCDTGVFHVFVDGCHFVLHSHDSSSYRVEEESGDGRLTAPFPGKIASVLVEIGDSVKRGTPLLVVEVMKMEHSILAPADGTVEDLLYQVGDQVTEGAQLLVFTQD